MCAYAQKQAEGRVGEAMNLHLIHAKVKWEKMDIATSMTAWTRARAVPCQPLSLLALSCFVYSQYHLGINGRRSGLFDGLIS